MIEPITVTVTAPRDGLAATRTMLCPEMPGRVANGMLHRYFELLADGSEREL